MKKLIIIISILLYGVLSYAQLPAPTAHQTLNNGEQMGVIRGKINTNGTNIVSYVSRMKDSVNLISSRILNALDSLLVHNTRLKTIENSDYSNGIVDSLSIKWGSRYGLDHYIVLKNDPALGYGLDLNINWSPFNPNGEGFKFTFDDGSVNTTSISSNNKHISFRDTAFSISVLENPEDVGRKWVFGTNHIWRPDILGNRRLAYYDEIEENTITIDSFFYSIDNGINGRLLYPKLPYTNIILTNSAAWTGSSPRMLTLNNYHNSTDIFQLNNLGTGNGFFLQNGLGTGFYLRNGEGTGLLLDDINSTANGLLIRHFPSGGYALQVTNVSANILLKVTPDSTIVGNNLYVRDSIYLENITYEPDQILTLTSTKAIKPLNLADLTFSSGTGDVKVNGTTAANTIAYWSGTDSTLVSNDVVKLYADSAVFTEPVIMHDSTYLMGQGVDLSDVWWSGTSNGAMDTGHVENAWYGLVHALDNPIAYLNDTRIVDGHKELKVWYIDDKTGEPACQYGIKGLSPTEAATAFQINHEFMTRYVADHEARLQKLEQVKKKDANLGLDIKFLIGLVIFVGLLGLIISYRK